MEALGQFLRVARRAGCPPDQVMHFWRGQYVPQPKQLLFHAAARAADAEGGPTQIGFGGARGPGKSHAIFAQLTLDDCQRQPGLKGLFLRKVGKQAREQFEDLRGAVLRGTRHEYKRQTGLVIFPNESRVFIGHFQNERDIDSYLGIEYDVVVVEEATTLTQTKYQAIRDSNRSSKTGWRPRVYTSTNPGGVGHTWYKRTFIEPWRDHREEDTRFVPGTVDDNKFIDPDYKKKLERNVGWRLRAYRFGNWDIAAGQFFTTFRHEVHVVAPFRVPSWWTVWLAMDYGFTHWNVVHVLAEDQEGRVWVVGEHAQRQWLVERHAQAVQELLGRLGIAHERVSMFVAGRDCFMARGNEGRSIADQWADEGWALTPANDDRVNGAAGVLRRLGDVEAGIAPTVQIFDTCARLAECLPALQHDPNRPEDVLKWDTDEEGDGGDDPYDALRYGLMAVSVDRRAVRAQSPVRGWRG